MYRALVLVIIFGLNISVALADDSNTAATNTEAPNFIIAIQDLLYLKQKGELIKENQIQELVSRGQALANSCQTEQSCFSAEEGLRVLNNLVQDPVQQSSI